MVQSRSKLTVKQAKRELPGLLLARALPVLDRYALLYSSFYSIFFNCASGSPHTTWSSPGPTDSPLCIISLYCSWQRRGHFSLQRDSPHPAPLWKSPAGLTKKWGGHVTQGLCRAEWDINLEMTPQGHLSPSPAPRKPDPYHLYP